MLNYIILFDLITNKIAKSDLNNPSFRITSEDGLFKALRERKRKRKIEKRVHIYSYSNGFNFCKNIFRKELTQILASNFIINTRSNSILCVIIVKNKTDLELSAIKEVSD